MSLIYFEPIEDELMLLGERAQVAYLHQPPQPGDRLTLGSARLWDVIAIDEYRSPQGFSDPIYFAHCHRGLVPPRSEWFAAQECKQRPSSLRLYLCNGELVHWSVNLTGDEPKTGILLPSFNVEAHTVTASNFGVEGITRYEPQEALEDPCYRSIWVGLCVDTSKTLERVSEALQTA